MKKSTKKLLIGTGITATILTAVATAYYVTAKTLMQIALDREIPKHNAKHQNKLSGSDLLGELMDKRKDFANKLEQLNCETVEIKNAEGLKLIGHFYRGTAPKRVIIAMHGWRSSWSQDFGLIANFWHQNDCAVLYAEQRGQGGSDGAHMGFGLLERHDCLDWVNWVNSQTEGNLPIYLAGISMGATTVLMAAGAELPMQVQGIIADCGFTDPQSIWKHVIQHNLHLPYKLYHAAARDMYRKKIQVASDSYSSIEAMKKCKVPVLFIHGSDDKFVPVEMTYQNYKACSAPKRLLIVPGAEHGMSYVIDQNAYESAVRNFWQDLEPMPHQ